MLLKEVKVLHDAAVETIVTREASGHDPARDYNRLFAVAFLLSDFLIEEAGVAPDDWRDVMRRSNVYTVCRVLSVMETCRIAPESAGFALAGRMPGRYRDALRDTRREFELPGRQTAPADRRTHALLTRLSDAGA